MSVEKIVITGGPCAGKSTAMSKIQKELSLLGYKVIFIAESATELITGGITPWEYEDFQTILMKYQLDKEKVYEEAAKRSGKKTLIVCDRGALDNRAYMNDEQFNKVLKEIGTTEVELRDSYGAVFHLNTVAKGAVEYYTLDNNAARTETPEQAIELDDKIINAWTGHPHFRVIDNSTDFSTKIKRLIKEITSYLGEPISYEIERKYLIDMPNMPWLTRQPNVQKVDILQTYLNSDPSEEVRVRQRGITFRGNTYGDSSYIYTKTTKRKVTDLTRVEVEKRLSKDEYLNELMNADISKHQIRKERYCMTYKNNYLEIDIYPFWKDKAILEVELSSEEAIVELPDELKVIKEVTNDDYYKNASLASMTFN